MSDISIVPLLYSLFKSVYTQPVIMYSVVPCLGGESLFVLLMYTNDVYCIGAVKTYRKNRISVPERKCIPVHRGDVAFSHYVGTQHDMRRPANVNMIVADALVPNRHQGISNNHAHCIYGVMCIVCITQLESRYSN